jgi:hypothetical protein
MMMDEMIQWAARWNVSGDGASETTGTTVCHFRAAAYGTLMRVVADVCVPEEKWWENRWDEFKA